MIVVDDTEQGLALWLPAGTRRKVPAPPVDATGPDLMLDLVVEPDRSWHWKDRHEFDQMERLNLLDDDSIGHIRREATTVLASIEAGAAPFCDPCPQWAPETDWPIPVLPKEWRSVVP